jgi:lysophospholipase L1-like esterase
MRQIRDDYHIKAILKGQSSTFIPQWAGGKFSVPIMLKQETPDVVIIALGGNELAMADPTVRTPDIEKIVGFMGQVPCVWVGTPSFGKENDLPKIIHDHSSPCRYYDSNALSPNLPRGSDKIHPTYDGQKLWATQVLEWVRKERDPATPDKFVLKARPASE